MSFDTIPLWLDIVDTSGSFLDTCTLILGRSVLWVVSTTSNMAGSGWKIVQSSVKLYQAKSKVVAHDNNTLPLLLAT